MSKAGKAVAKIACVLFEADHMTQHLQNYEIGDINHSGLAAC